MAESPDFSGGYAGEATFAGGGGYDPFDPKNYTGPIAPDLRGGYAGEATFAGGGGAEPGTVRDLGASATTALKPDGTPTITASPGNVGVGSATVSTGAIPTSPFGTTEAASVIPSLLNSAVSTKTPTADALLSVQPNPLELFASYSPLWTMACLTPLQYNDPASYRNNPADLKNIIMSSAGRFDESRVKTSQGIPEFFINNFTMKSVIAPNEKSGNSNVFNFEWEIYEPYSMGLFLQSLQIAALAAGYINYLSDAVYVLRCDFQGYDELGRNYAIVKPKYFTVKLTQASFTVNEGGSTYKLIAVPYNHSAFSDTVNTMFNDVKIVPKKFGTVEEALAGNSEGSLVATLNRIETQLQAAGKIIQKDVYDIQFPINSDEFRRKEQNAEPGSATVVPGAETTSRTITGTNSTDAASDFENNTIGKSSFGFDVTKGGNYPFRKHDDTVDANGLIVRDNMTIDPKARVFQFGQGQTITSIITSIIKSSDYGKAAIDPKNKINGMLKWFKIDIQVELLLFDTLTGDFARKFTFRIVPYMIHESIFTTPNTALEYADIQKNIVKGYDYIYTGKNVDIIKFDISIDHLFYTGVQPTDATKGEQNNPDGASGPAKVEPKEASIAKNSSTLAMVATGGRARLLRNPSSLRKEEKGGSGIEDSAQKVAQEFHKAFTQSNVEMVNVNLEILGDPFYLVDSGMGNYFSPVNSDNSQITEDGTMNYEGGDVYVYLTFRTPSDVNTATGLYDFGKEVSVSPFSGIYRVTEVESVFTEMFTQKLTMVRMPGQAFDYANTPPEVQASLEKIDKTQSASTIIGGTVPDSSSLTGDIIPSILVSNPPPRSNANANAVPGEAAIIPTGPESPDFRGGAVTNSTPVASGGGYDPATGAFASNSANSIGGSAAITPLTNVGPSFAGGAVGGPSVASGGGYDPATDTFTSNSANSIGGSRAIT